MEGKVSKRMYLPPLLIQDSIVLAANPALALPSNQVLAFRLRRTDEEPGAPGRQVTPEGLASCSWNRAMICKQPLSLGVRAQLRQWVMASWARQGQ